MEIAPPVLIKGPGFDLREIRSVAEAIDYLEEWPANARSPFWYLASNALRGAEDGSMQVEHARDAFEAFCKGSGVLLVKLGHSAASSHSLMWLQFAATSAAATGGDTELPQHEI